MPKSTSPTSSRTKRTGKLTGPLMSAKEFDSIVIEMGGRLTTPEESRLFREAIARTDAKIARQLAAA
jgi:hypothetical protein